MRKGFVLLVIMLAALMLASPAFADTASYTINLSNAGGLAPSNTVANGGYSTITLTLVDSHHISFYIQGFNSMATGSSISTHYNISDFGLHTCARLRCGTLNFRSLF